MKPITVKAPARVCLFGDHQDYLGLPVIACAINRYITFTARPNNNLQLSFNFADLNKELTILLSEDPSVFEPQDYIKSGLKVLQDHGITLAQGYDIQVSGDIPINAGLSSSSAFVVGWLTLVLKLTGNLERFSSAEIGHMAYKAEVQEHGQSGGKMDQYTSAIGGTIFIDTSEDMSYTTLKNLLNPLIIASSGVPKATLESLRNLNEKAHKAIAQVKENHPDFDIRINQTPIGYIENVQEDLKDIFSAALANHQTTQLAQYSFQAGRPKALGPIMDEHHKILKEYLKITTPEIDALIDAAKQAGALGAKIVGSGGGGCIVCIPAEDNKEELISALKAAGAAEVFEAQVSKGANDLTL